MQKGDMAAAGRFGIIAGCASHDSIVAFRLCKIKVLAHCHTVVAGVLRQKKAVDSSSGINGVFVVQQLDFTAVKIFCQQPLRKKFKNNAGGAVMVKNMEGASPPPGRQLVASTPPPAGAASVYVHAPATPRELRFRPARPVRPGPSRDCTSWSRLRQPAAWGSCVPGPARDCTSWPRLRQPAACGCCTSWLRPVLLPDD